MRSNFLHIISANISEKLMPYTSEKFLATSFALNLYTNASVLYLALKIYFNLIAFFPGGSLFYIYIWWFSKFCNSFFMASCYWHLCIKSWITSSYDISSYILLFDLVINITTLYSFSSFMASVFYVISIAMDSKDVGCSGIGFFHDLVLGHGLPVETFFEGDVCLHLVIQ